MAVDLFYPYFRNSPIVSLPLSLRILQPGLLTTLQDLGRTGYRSSGINPTGAMDTTAAALTNALVGNEPTEGVLEFHFPFGEIRLETDACVAIGGADFRILAEGKALHSWQPYFLPAGSTLVSHGRQNGARVYLAVGGGFAIEPWLGSVSTHLKAHAGGFVGRSLQKGDVLPINHSRLASGFVKDGRMHRLPWRIAPAALANFYRRDFIHLIPGPEWETLTPQAKEAFASQSFRISNRSDRMGYRLSGPSLERIDRTELVSSAVTKGTIQLLPDGQLILLMADHQTTGGYPRVGTVIAADLPALAQLSAGESVQFALTSVEEAEQCLMRHMQLQNIIHFAANHRLQHYFSRG